MIQRGARYNRFLKIAIRNNVTTRHNPRYAISDSPRIVVRGNRKREKTRTNK